MYEHNYFYHSPAGYVYTERLALEISAIWDGIESAEAIGIPLEKIAGALVRNWTATVVALARGNLATLRVLIEASPGAPK